MYIGLFLGHSVLKSGNITSASSQYGNEYKINKELIVKVEHYLKKAGVKVDTIIIPEKTLENSKQESTYKLPKANSGKYTMIVELHLNASNGAGYGAEVLYCTGSTKGKAIAQKIQDKLVEAGFRDRKIKDRNNLYMLTKTTPPAVILESFFVDNKEDVELYKKIGADELGRLIAEGISGKSIPRNTPTPASPSESTNKPTTNSTGKYRVVVGSYEDKNNAIATQEKLKKAGFDSFLVFEKDL